MESRNDNKSPKPLSESEKYNEMLKKKQRFGDPCAGFLKKKERKKEEKKETKEEKGSDKKENTRPIYQGKYPQNRFDIKPDYKWDGIDRGNGYEKHYFDVLNRKTELERMRETKDVSGW